MSGIQVFIETERMSLIIIALCAFLASVLTFFSGFGLGTLLTPVFALWFPLDVSVGMTAVVHLLNNGFKFFLVKRYVDREVALRFGLPAVGAAVLGAWILLRMSGSSPWFHYEWGGRTFEVLPLKVVIAAVMIFFTLFEWIPALRNWSVDRKYLVLGGLLSGFFGGLSGHQGALRSAFLIRADLSKEAFIATGVVIACAIDVFRLGVYFERWQGIQTQTHAVSIGVATLAAFVGAYFGNRSLKKLTLAKVQGFVSIGLLIFALALGGGLI